MTKLYKNCTSLLVGLALTASASAGYINFGYDPADFALIGGAWDPGVNTARIGGNPAPGGATWSVMGAGVADSAIHSHGGAFTTALAALYVGGVDEITTVGLTLDKWAAVSGFSNLGMVADGGAPFGTPSALGVLGDIRVGAVFIDGGVGPNVLAHAFGPGTPAIFGTSNGGDTHFDDGNIWSDGGVGGTIDFHTVALHEFGHAIGLDHSAVVGAVMEPFYAGARRTLHADDIAGAVAIYGPAVGSVPDSGPTALLLGAGLLGLAAIRRRLGRS